MSKKNLNRHQKEERGGEKNEKLKIVEGKRGELKCVTREEKCLSRVHS